MAAEGDPADGTTPLASGAGAEMPGRGEGIAGETGLSAGLGEREPRETGRSAGRVGRKQREVAWPAGPGGWESRDTGLSAEQRGREPCESGRRVRWGDRAAREENPWFRPSDPEAGSGGRDDRGAGRRADGFGREIWRSVRVPGVSIVMLGWGTGRSRGAPGPPIVRCGNGIGRSARPGRPIGVAIARPAIPYGPGGAGARSVPGNAGRLPGPGGTGNSCGFLIWPAGPGGSGSWPIIVAPSSPAMRPSTGRPGSCCTPAVTAAAWCPPMP